MNIATSVPQAWVLVAMLWGQSAMADESPKDSGKAAARCASVSGVLLVGESNGTFKPLQTGSAVPSGGLLIGMPRVELVSTAGTVGMCLLADIGNRGPLPVLEAGVVLHDAQSADFDFSLKRGIVVLENLKKAGEAKVRLRIGDET